MMVDTFFEIFEMEIVEKKGTSCRRLYKMHYPHIFRRSKIFVWGTINYTPQNKDVGRLNKELRVRF